jgi:hypothetical protein
MADMRYVRFADPLFSLLSFSSDDWLFEAAVKICKSIIGYLF